VAAKGSDAGDGGTVGAGVMKTQELGSPQREEVLGVAPEETFTEEFAASGAMHDVPGAEHASGGGLKSGGRSSGVGASGFPMGPTAASKRQQSQSSSGQDL